MAREVISPEVSVRHAVAQHVVSGCEHGGRDGKDGLLGAAAGLDAQELSGKVARCEAYSCPGGADQCGLEPSAALAHTRAAALPALSSLRGHRPAQDTRWPA